jgi:hypothetical protein
MKIYSYEPFTKIFSNVGVAEKNQLNLSEYIFPAFCTTVQPPSFPQGKQAYWNGSSWEIQDKPVREPDKPIILETPKEPTPEPYVEPAPTWESVRAMRTAYLGNCDWVVLPDSNPLNKSEWLAYRQALRDITNTFSSPESVVWPTMPH